MPRDSFSGYLEPNDIRAVIDAIPLVSKHPERDTLLIELLWQSGARVSEALTLTPEHIGTTSVVLRNLKQVKRVEKKLVHDPTAVKEVEISSQLCQHLTDFCERNKVGIGQYVFYPNRSGKYPHLYREYVWALLDKASASVGIRIWGKKDMRTGGRFKGAYPHLFRHSNAMKLLDDTSDITLVQAQLGHASVKSTQMYAWTKRPKIRKVIASIEW